MMLQGDWWLCCRVHGGLVAVLAVALLWLCCAALGLHNDRMVNKVWEGDSTVSTGWSRHAEYKRVKIMIDRKQGSVRHRLTMKMARSSETNNHGNGSELRQRYQAGLIPAVIPSKDE